MNMQLQISEQDYHADKVHPKGHITASRSLLYKYMTESPKEAWAEHPRLNPSPYPRQPSEALEMGSFIHRLLCGDDTGVLVIDEDSYRPKRAQELRLTARESGRIPMLSREYMETLDRAQKFGELIKDIWPTNPEAEQTFIWQDHGAWFRCRPDVVDTEANLVIDWKTCSDLSDGAIRRSINRFGYWFQVEFYRRGIEAVTGKRPDFLMVFLRVTGRPAIRIARLGDDWQAGDIVEGLMHDWSMSLANDEWPDYAPLTIPCPDYFDRWSERVANGE